MPVDNEVVQTLPSTLELRLLGTFDVRIQGRPLPPLRYRKEQWLLALLALRHDQDVSRDWLAAAFWPENDVGQGKFYLRKALSNLRSALGSEAHRLLSPTSRTIRLDLDGAFADFLALTVAVARPRTEAHHEERLLEAVKLYTGPLLPDCQEEWMALERESCTQSYLKALETLAEYALARGEAVVATRWLRRAITAEPYRESAVRSLMQALADSGDRAAVQQVYQDLRHILRDRINASPSPETEALYKQLAEREVQPPTQSRLPVSPLMQSRRQLPVPLTDLVGREKEIEQVGDWLQHRRLVTLLGPGGVGKTRLAIAIAEATMPQFADGVWFVDLAPVTEASSVLEATAKALRVTLESGQSAEEQLFEALAPRALLLILDNCEHLLDACSSLADRLLSTCPDLRILATSRQALGVTGEQVYPIPSLALPTRDEMEERPGLLTIEKNPAFLLEYAGIQLFVQRAVQANPSFRLDRRNAQAVMEICRRLDGIPLAIEMAAARLRSLSAGDIQNRLDSRFRLLTSGSRSALPRQQTLRAALDWSYDLLDAPERELLDRLSVFVGGCSLEGAAAVSGATDEDGVDTYLGILTSLVDKSLLIYDGISEPPRYRMLETIHQYGRERLVEHGAMERAQQLHLQYCVDLGRRATLLSAEMDNLVAALEFCQAKGEHVEVAIQLCTYLYAYWSQHSPTQGRKWIAMTLGLPGASQYPEERANLLGYLATLAYYQGDIDEASQRAQESVEVARSLDNPQVLAHSLGRLAITSEGQGKFAEASALFEECRRLHQQIGNVQSAITALSNQGLMYGEMGDSARAYELLEESLAQYRANNIQTGVGFALHSLSYQDYLKGDYALAEQRDLEALQIYRTLNDSMWQAVTLQHLGWINYALGNPEQAMGYCRACLRLQYEVRRKVDVAVVLQCLAFRAFDLGNWTAAACLWGADSTLRETLKKPDPQFHVEEYRRRLAETEAQLGSAAFQQAWAEGRQMSMDQCIDYGLTYP